MFADGFTAIIFLVTSPSSENEKTKSVRSFATRWNPKSTRLWNCDQQRHGQNYEILHCHSKLSSERTFTPCGRPCSRRACARLLKADGLTEHIRMASSNFWIAFSRSPPSARTTPSFSRARDSSIPSAVIGAEICNKYVFLIAESLLLLAQKG